MKNKSISEVPNGFEVIIRPLEKRGKRGTDHVSIRLKGREICYAFITSDGLLVFVEHSLPEPGKIPQGLDAAIGHIILTYGRKAL